MSASAAAPIALHVLSFNSGSSSLKFALHRCTATTLEMLVAGSADANGSAGGQFQFQAGPYAPVVVELGGISVVEQIVERVLEVLRTLALPAPAAVGHRIVHGGPRLRQHARLDAQVLATLESARAFAPLHAAAALEVIRCTSARLPALPQVVCLDTSFHADMPAVAQVLPLAKSLRDRGLQRYGFHGLSCASIVRALADELPARVVIAHLGSGVSLTAVLHGQSIDTSMGLTPTGGVLMATRSGDLDPGILLHLLREEHYDLAMLTDLVDHRCGLLGVSGIASDIRLLHAAGAVHADAQLAIAMFCYAVRKQIAAMVAALNGIDMLVFTGGIGENDAAVRAAICAGLGWLGIALDHERNTASDSCLDLADARCAVRVVAAQENAQIAHHVHAILAPAPTA